MNRDIEKLLNDSIEAIRTENMERERVGQLAQENHSFQTTC